MLIVDDGYKRNRTQTPKRRVAGRRCVLLRRARARFAFQATLPRQPTDFRRQVPLQLGSYRSAEQPVPRAAAMMNHVQHGFSSKNLCIRPREPRGQKVYEDNTYTAEEVCAFFT